MIFVTVGTQFAFDRLIKTLDSWAFNNPDTPVFGQIGNSDFIPKTFPYKAKMNSEEFQSEFDKASVIVAHAGMGTIISSLLVNKPIIIMPRNSELGEHRNQHQFSTAKKFADYCGCYVAKDENELIELLNQFDQLNGGLASDSNILLGQELDLRIDKLFEK